MTAASLQQRTFRGRDDTVALNSTTFTHAANTNWTQAADASFRVRFVVQETNARSINITFACHYSLNGGAYAVISTTTPVRVVDSPHYADGDLTSKLLDGTGTFVAGVGDDADNVMPTSGNISLSASGNTEVEINLRANSAQVNNGDAIALRLYQSNGSALNTYTSVPTLTVSSGATVAPGAATHAHAAASPAVVQAHAATPDGAAHAHAGAATTLAQVQDLAPESAAHGHGASEAGLVYAHIAAPDAATHAHAAAHATASSETFSDTDVAFLLSGGAGNADPAASLGGASGAEVAAASGNLFDAITGAESTDGDVEYRCFYVRNEHAAFTWVGPRLWISVQTTSPGTHLDLGLDPAGLNGTATTVVDEGTAPAGVTFTHPTTHGDGLPLGDLGPGAYRAVWVRRTVQAGAGSNANDTATLRVSASPG